MTIVDFFQQSAGKWLSQRTSQNLSSMQSIAGTTDLWIEPLGADDREVVELQTKYGTDPALFQCGARIRWETKPTLDNRKESGATILVAFGSKDTPQEGKLLQKSTLSPTTFGASRYTIGTDEAVTLITESDTMYAEERLWFASPNLRLRTSFVKHNNGTSLTSFCSEIRMGNG